MDPTTYLVDGYNVIRRTPRFAAAERHSLEGGRDALLEELRQHFRQSAHNAVVVFDGAGADETSETLKRCRVRVVFSRAGESADAVIQRLAGDIAVTGRIVTVISDDLDIRLGVRESGGEVIGTQALARQLGAPDRYHEKRMRHVGYVRERQRAEQDEPTSTRRSGNPRRRPRGQRDSVRRERLW